MEEEDMKGKQAGRQAGKKRRKQKLQKLELAFVCKRHFEKSCSQDLAFLRFYQLFNIFIVVRLFVIVRSSVRLSSQTGQQQVLALDQMQSLWINE